MEIDIRAIIQRLLLLGVPLLSNSCGNPAGPALGSGGNGMSGGGRSGSGGTGGGAFGGMFGTGGVEGPGGAGGGSGGLVGGLGGGGAVGGGSGSGGSGAIGGGSGLVGGGGTAGGSPGGAGGAPMTGTCIGGWGTNMMIGSGCESGPYHYTRDEYRALDSMDAQQLQRYLACTQSLDCADFAQICQGMLDKKYPYMLMNLVSEDATLKSCTPACMSPAQPGVHIVFDVTGFCEGRRPQGLQDEEAPCGAGHPVGLLFAEAARLEAASVPAFAHLARELRALGAPEALIDGATRARRDEVRHTRQVRALARRFGATPRSPRVRKMDLRPLENVARENAVEGAVRETYGALVAWWQALHAEDMVVQSTMRAVAADETRHAILAHEVDVWARARLSSQHTRSLDDAREQAFDDLSVEVARAEVPDPVIRQAGYPSTAASQWLIESLRRELS